MEIFNATNLLYIWGGFVKTIEISALSIFFSLIFGTVLALVKSYAPRPFCILVSAYIELFRCTKPAVDPVYLLYGAGFGHCDFDHRFYAVHQRCYGRDCARRPQLDSARPV
ncbi:MAG: hypothetical protein ACLUQW_07045 [Collinsella sp.]